MERMHYTSANIYKEFVTVFKETLYQQTEKLCKKEFSIIENGDSVNRHNKVERDYKIDGTDFYSNYITRAP